MAEAVIARATGSGIPGIQCCCGSNDCIFLAHNGRLLEGLERDVSKAAQLGQALLVRHEAYVADSERERQTMLSTIEGLEKEKLELEEKNAQSIKANRELLDQLEQLNEAVATSDAQVQALTNALHSTEEEIQRLSSLAAKTQSLERQLIDLEHEQSQLQSALDSKIGDERTAVQRWRRAERMIADLQDQIDRIEKESREERERHVQVVARMERRMAVEGELATAAGRLKAKAGHDKGGGTNVVSHFVKDILLDNANLQHGISELREMLLNSNEEVERLREQLRVHQPVSPTDVEDDVEPAQAAPTLQKELGEPFFSQELHIHHHYHGSTPTHTPKPQGHRRPRKKRFSLTPAHFTPPAQTDPSTQVAILSQTAVTVPNSNRWSNATTLAPSLPGSPLSISRRGSIYDRVFSDVPYDSSQPTSPSDSVDLQSPLIESKSFSNDTAGFHHYRKKSQSLKPPSLTTIRSVSTPISVTSKSSPASAIVSAVSPSHSLVNDDFTLSPSMQPQSTIAEEPEDAISPARQELEHEAISGLRPLKDDGDDTMSPLAHIRSSLRRAVSHESLISISGMDIHTLRSRPSQLLFSSSPAVRVHPELTPWTATATANVSRRNLDSSIFNRSLLYSNPTTKGNTSSGGWRSEGLGKKVGGWVFGRWGATPAPSSPRPDSSKSAETQSSTNTVKKGGEAKKKEIKLRPAGVNQSGPIWGFFDVPETPTKIVVDNFDADALGEALAEE